MTTFSFAQVIITEIADPNNNADARYIELHNLGGTAVDFSEGNGWQIDKYLNGNSGVNATLDLTGVIPAGGFYIIAYDNTPGTFDSVYGLSAQQYDGVLNGVAGSNGDDDLALVDGTDTIVDFFGVYDFGMDINTDNTGTCAEYEDGRAERLTSVTTGNTSFDESEWNVWADSTVGGCTSHVNAPRTAPGDFDPGAWGTPTCGFSFSNPSATCDAITAGTDTYTATIDFTGGGNPNFNVFVSSGTVDLTAGDPAGDTSGTITITGLTEGVDVTITAQDGALCDVMFTITAATCEPANALPYTDAFSYADGSLINNPAWDNHSGTNGDLLVASGQAVVQHGTPSEDAGVSFNPVTGVIYYAFDFSVDDLGAPYSNTGTDYEYFAHFMGTGPFAARMDIVPPAGGGDYSVGIASDESTADATWPTDLTFGTTYRAIVGYDQDTNIAQLWIDASLQSDPSILGEDRPDPGTAVDRFALRQSDSDENETVRVDNLVISQNFNDLTLSTNSVVANNNFKLYPNPNTSGMLYVSTTQGGTVDIAIFDVLGKQVINTKVLNNQIDVSALNSGMYIVKLRQGNANITKKLVIE